MMQTLGVNSLKDIFDLTVDDILKLEGFKQKSANNLFNEINSARRVEDFKVLAALNIRGVGKNVSKTILEHYTICELRKLNTEQLSEIDGVGPERAEALFCELRKQSESLDELMNAVTILQTKGASAVKRPTICFTGKMPEKRSYYEKLAAERGWEATSSVTKELSILVANDPAAGGGKLKKAEKLGIEILSLDDWLKKEPVELPAPQEKRQKEGTDEELKTASETKEENERAFSDELPLFDIAQEMEKNDELFENSSEDGFLPGF
jgi:DNA ligase (NAD+)